MKAGFFVAIFLGFVTHEARATSQAEIPLYGHNVNINMPDVPLDAKVFNQNFCSSGWRRLYSSVPSVNRDPSKCGKNKLPAVEICWLNAYDARKRDVCVDS